MSDILNYFNIPSNCKAIKKLKTYLLENYPLKSNDKNLIKQHTKSIVLHYILNQSKINISRFEDEEKRYVEIYVMVVELFDNEKTEQISNLIQAIFQKPIILIFQHETKVSINIANKRINKSDSTKLVVEESYFSDWIDLESMTKLENDFIASLSIQNHPFTDFFSFYNSYLDKIIAFNASEYTGNLSSSDDTKELLEKIREVESNINDTVSRIKKETSLKVKVNMNIELKKLNDTLSELKSSI